MAMLAGMSNAVGTRTGGALVTVRITEPNFLNFREYEEVWEEVTSIIALSLYLSGSGAALRTRSQSRGILQNAFVRRVQYGSDWILEAVVIGSGVIAGLTSVGVLLKTIASAYRDFAEARKVVAETNVIKEGSPLIDNPAGILDTEDLIAILLPVGKALPKLQAERLEQLLSDAAQQLEDEDSDSDEDEQYALTVLDALDALIVKQGDMTIEERE